MTLTEFLLARIAEDETEIGPPFGHDDSAGPNGLGWAEVGAISDVLLSSAKRARAECESKRRLVNMLSPELGNNQMFQPSPHQIHGLQILAAVYADHPDYREEWRP